MDAPTLSMFRPVAVQIAPGTYRPFYPFAAVQIPDAPLRLDGWLHCQPADAFNRWIKDTNAPELPSRQNPFIWVEGLTAGDRIGQYHTGASVGDLLPVFRELARG